VAASPLAVAHIPIIFEPLSVTPDALRDAQRRFGLESSRYVIATNGTRQDKGLRETIGLTRLLRQAGQNLKLIIVGKERDAPAELQPAIQEGLAASLGPLNHELTLALMGGADMHINLSMIEGLPRGSLEAMWLGIRTLLPSNVPEFQSAVPHL